MKCAICGLEKEDFLGGECRECVIATLRKHNKPVNKIKQHIRMAYNNNWNMTEDELRSLSSSFPMPKPYETKRERDAELKAHRYKTVLFLVILIGIPLLFAILKV